MAETTQAVPPPRVFISYAHDSIEHRAMVRDLWLLLRSLGIDAKLDLVHDGPDWAMWMEQQVRAAEHVLVIGSPEYRRRADGEAPMDQGRGVWFEARLLRDVIYGDKGTASLRRILPVVLPGRSVADLPMFLAPNTGVHYQVTAITKAGLGQLLDVLLGEAPALEPDLGPRAARVGLRHELIVDVSADGGHLRSRVELAGTVLCECDGPVPDRLDRVWAALGGPTPEALDEFAQAGRRLATALFDADTLDRLTTLVTTSPFGTVVDVVFLTDGPRLALPYELLRLSGERPLAVVAGVRILRRIRGLDRAPTLPAAGPLKILAAVAAPERTARPPLDEAEMQVSWR